MQRKIQIIARRKQLIGRDFCARFGGMIAAQSAFWQNRFTSGSTVFSFNRGKTHPAESSNAKYRIAEDSYDCEGLRDRAERILGTISILIVAR